MNKPSFDVFLSYNGVDQLAVDELARRLEEKGVKPWLDKWNLIPGEPWQEAIEEALDACASCAVIIGPSGIGPWQNEEMRAAIDQRVHKREFRVIPVVLPGGQRERRSHLPTFLVQTTWVEFQHSLDDETALHRLICGIRGIEPGAEAGPSAYEGISPYRGLQVFQAEHASFFFGREALTGWLLEMLRPRAASHLDNRFLAVIGPSGSGKSSLVRAGLIPALKKGEFAGSAEWMVVMCRPGSEPLTSLATALVAEPANPDMRVDIKGLIAGLRKDKRELHLFANRALRNQPKDQRILLLVDQFEEIFTMCRDESQRRALVDNLVYTSSVVGGRLIVVVTMRADFYAKCAAYPELAAAVSEHQVLVGSMTEDELRRAIERPAQRVGCELEKGLTEMLLQDLKDEAGALPLLEHTLMELWERRDGRRLTIAAYKEIGEIEGALEQYANTIFGQLSTPQQEVCKHIFLRLTQPGEGTEDTKRRLARKELEASESVAPVLQHLIKARLLTAESEEHERGKGEQVFIEVSHEALIRGWSKFRVWIDTDREMVRLEHRLSEAAKEWQDAGEDPAFLYRGVRLAEAEAWAESHSKEIVSHEREFLEASIALRTQEQQEKELQQQHELAMARQLAETERQSSRRLRRRAWWLSIACVIALTTAATAVVSYFDASAAKESATAELAKRLWRRAIIERDINGDWLKASHDLMEAAQLANDDVRAKQSAYFAGSMLVKTASLQNILEHRDSVRGARLIDERGRLLTWSDDGSARLWNLKSGKQLVEMQHGKGIRNAIVSKDQRRILTWSRDGTVVLWRIEDGKQQATLAHRNIRGTLFSPDERRLLTWDKAGSAIMWDLETRKELVRLKHTKRINGAVFSKLKPRLLTWSLDGTAVLWNSNTGQRLFSLKYNQQPIWGAEFSSDEQRILTWGNDSIARLWQASNGKQLLEFQHHGPVWGGQFRRSNKEVLTWSDDGTVVRWNAETGEKLVAMQHEGHVRGATFSPNEDWILSWSDDNTARVWDTESGQLLRRFPHKGPVQGAVFSPDDEFILTWSDNAAWLWTNQSAQRETPPLRHKAKINQALFAANGQQVVSASEDGSVRLWQIQELVPLEFPMQHESSVVDAMYQPDSRHLLSWIVDGTLWKWASDKIPHTFDKQQLSGRFNGAGFSQDGSQLLTWSADGDARLWATSTGEQVIPSMLHGSSVFGALFDSQERLILSWSEDGIARLWDRQTGELLTSQEHGGPVTGAVFSPESKKILTWSSNGTGWLWGDQGLAHKTKLKDMDSLKLMSAAVFSNDGQRVLMLDRGGNGRFLDTQSGEFTQDFPLHNGRINGAIFSESNRRLLTWSADKSARLWDTTTHTMSIPPLYHNSNVRGARFNRDETRVLTWSSDGRARVWDSATGRPLTPAIRHEHNRPINGARFVLDDKWVLTWSDDKSVRFWNLETDQSGFDEPVLYSQVRTGTVLNEEELEVITKDDWLLKKTLHDK